MLVLGGTASNGIDIGLSRVLGYDLEKIETSKFPDGEIKVRVPEIKEGKVVIVQSTHYPQEKNLFELLLTADAIKGNNVEITAVIPYLAYARQNRSFYPGEGISISTVMSLLKAVGIRSLVTVNPHRSGPLMNFGGKIEVIRAERRLAQHLIGVFKRPMVLAPDSGGVELARSAAEVLGCEFTYLDKNRDAYGNVSIKEAHGGDFAGKDVIIFDDIISSGGTIELAARHAYSKGAASVSAAGVHLIMVEGAAERLKNAGVQRIFGTNTVPYEKAEMVDISEDIAEGIRRMERDIS